MEMLVYLAAVTQQGSCKKFTRIKVSGNKFFLSLTILLILYNQILFSDAE